jgi:hypothetical protein
MIGREEPHPLITNIKSPPKPQFGRPCRASPLKPIPRPKDLGSSLGPFHGQQEVRLRNLRLIPTNAAYHPIAPIRSHAKPGRTFKDLSCCSFDLAAVLLLCFFLSAFARPSARPVFAGILDFAFLDVFAALREFFWTIGYRSFAKRRDRVDTRRTQCR